MTSHDTSLSEHAIRDRVRILLDRAGNWTDDHTDLLSYMGLARLCTNMNGHRQFRVVRLPLIGLEDPGIERLMLRDALMDCETERHPGMPLPGIFLP